MGERHQSQAKRQYLFGVVVVGRHEYRRVLVQCDSTADLIDDLNGRWKGLKLPTLPGYHQEVRIDLTECWYLRVVGSTAPVYSVTKLGRYQCSYR